MTRVYDRCERIREAVARAEIRAYLTCHIPKYQRVKIVVDLPRVLFLLFDAELFYEVSQKVGHNTCNHGKAIETVVNIETEKGTIPWKCLLHSDENSAFQEKYGEKIPIHKETRKYNLPFKRR